MSDYGFDLVPIFRGIIIFFFLVIAIIISIFLFREPDYIKSREKINPEIELVIENNKVDTIYVYKISKNGR